MAVGERLATKGMSELGLDGAGGSLWPTVRAARPSPSAGEPFPSSRARNGVIASPQPPTRSSGIRRKKHLPFGSPTGGRNETAGRQLADIQSKEEGERKRNRLAAR